MKILTILLILLILFSGCSKKDQRTFYRISPEITSNTRVFSFSSLENDDSFFGDWGGAEFDGDTFRAVHKDGAGIRFKALKKESLIAKLTVKPENDLKIILSLNKIEIKEISLNGREKREIKLFFSKTGYKPDITPCSLKGNMAWAN